MCHRILHRCSLIASKSSSVCVCAGPLQQDPAVTAFIYEALAYLAKPMKDQTVSDLLGIALKTGEINIRAMELLNQGHISRFGAPVPTKVRTSPVAGKCILVSGHDLHDLEKVLQMTDGTGINVYTHGEMLPAHGYPGLKKYKHLVCLSCHLPLHG
jgi:hydroxylamine reductase